MHIRLPLALLSALAAPLPASTARADDCPLLKAVYAPLDPEDDMSASAGEQNTYRLRHVEGRREHSDSSYVMRLTEEKQKIGYNFGFVHLDGYGGIALIFLGSGLPRAPYQIKSADPQSRIMYFGSDLKAVEPDRENPGAAPAYLIMPQIGNSFWYWTPGKRKFVPPPGLWKIVSCGG